MANDNKQTQDNGLRVKVVETEFPKKLFYLQISNGVSVHNMNISEKRYYEIKELETKK